MIRPIKYYSGAQRPAPQSYRRPARRNDTNITQGSDPGDGERRRREQARAAGGRNAAARCARNGNITMPTSATASTDRRPAPLQQSSLEDNCPSRSCPAKCDRTYSSIQSSRREQTRSSEAAKHVRRYAGKRTEASLWE
ncbi:hypothetical protein PENSPDRAFT_222986 [Peniophora sp. CONT]|nr:hypothetical protein PENSPDRAFT_222986 [Peniophora sp. CONT]